jgi:hypothetical protein
MWTFTAIDLSKWSRILHIHNLWLTHPNTARWIELADIMVVATLLIVAAVASIVFTSSYKKLFRSVVKNSSTLNVVETVAKDCIPRVEKPVEEIHVVEATQAPPEKNQPTQDTTSTEPITVPNNVQETHPDPSSNIEQQIPTVVVEVTQQTSSPEKIKATPQRNRNSRAGKKRRAARTRATKRVRKKASEAQHIVESQPPG